MWKKEVSNINWYYWMLCDFIDKSIIGLQLNVMILATTPSKETKLQTKLLTLM